MRTRTAPSRCPLLAPALATYLGANSLALELLLQRYRDSGAEGLVRYLVDHCGVPADEIAELRSLVQDGKQERREAAERVIKELHERLAGLPPALEAELCALYVQGRDLQTRDAWQLLQDHGIPLHRVADLCGGRPPSENLEHFIALLRRHRAPCLASVAIRLAITEPGEAFDALEHSYERLRLPLELAWRLGSTEGYDQPILGWLRKHGLDDALPIDFSPELKDLWEALVDEHTRRDEAQKDRCLTLNRFRPWVIAAARASTGRGVEDLAPQLDDLDLSYRISDGLSNSDVLQELHDWLRLHRVQEAIIETLLRGWPELPNDPAVLGLNADSLRVVEQELRETERTRARRRARKVHIYRNHLDRLVLAGSLKEEPDVLALVSAPPGNRASGTESECDEKRRKQSPTPQRQGSQGPGHYAHLNFARDVTGRCGEEFVLLLQRRRWRALAADQPDRARQLLAGIRKLYRGIEGSEEATEWWRWLDQNDPSEWTSDHGWPRLHGALHMSAWRPEAPYDILGLDREGPDDAWSVYRIEVKATSLVGRPEFPISEGELQEAENDGPSYVIWRVRQVVADRVPTFFRLPDPHAMLTDGRLTKMPTVSVLEPHLGTK